MTEKQIELLTSKILEGVPENIKPIEYLIDTLSIGKESAYRRMRGEIPFTFDEIAVLSLKLGFSVDEIIGKNVEERFFFDLQVNRSSRSEESFMAMLEEYCKFIDFISNPETADVLVAVNRLSLFLLIEYDSLFKLYYYNWVHQTHNFSLSNLYSDTVIPYEIMELRKKFINKKKSISNINFILDRDIFLNVTREIQYYYNRKLISDEEVTTLKKDLINLLKNVEQLMQRGVSPSGSSYNFYLSLLGVETNTNCATYGDNIASLYWLYPINALVIFNQEICYMQKKWLEALKKFSVLITLSNEILQAEYIAKQEKYIEDIHNELAYF
jgi:hypothetical protein